MWETLLPVLFMTVNAIYLVKIFRDSRLQANKSMEHLIRDASRVMTLGVSRTLKLVATVAECVLEHTRDARCYVSILPAMENPEGPHVLAMYDKYKPNVRIRKDWVDAAHVLSSKFPDIEAAWRDWVGAYSDLASIEPGAPQEEEEAKRILGELLIAKGRLMRSLLGVVKTICVIES